MTKMLLEFLSLEYSGLIMALALLLVCLILLWRQPSPVLKWILRITSVAAIVLAIGAVTHILRVQGIASENPPPGKMVDVGGYSMHVLAEGPTESLAEGPAQGPAKSPAIVWFSGGHSAGLGFWDQHKAVRGKVRSILVDRHGTGWSDTGPFPRTTAREADEVVRALEAAGEEGPFIWTGHSFGGLLAANIARRYPEKTAAVTLLDPTPLDVLFYGADKKGLASWSGQAYRTGFLRLFGFYRLKAPPAPPRAKGDSAPDPDVANSVHYYFESDPIATARAIESRAGSSFAHGSSLQELSAHGLVDRAWDTVVYDGELGNIPLYLIAPGEDASTIAYAEQVVGPGPEAQRFANFLTASRERFMSTSSNSKRIYAPAGTGHNFPSEDPGFVTETLLRIARDVSGFAEIDADTYAKLTTAWPGDYGGLPPLDLATPENLEAAYRQAVAEKRAEIRAIAASSEPPDFANTILALESSGLALQRIDPILRIFSSTKSNPEIAALAARLAPLKPELDDEIAHNAALFERVEAVYAGLPDSAPDTQARRLVEVVRDGMKHAGAELSPENKARLSSINGRLAELQTQFGQNVSAEEALLVFFIDSEEGLAGLNDTEKAAARSAAEARGKPEAWAIPIARPTVWPFLTKADNRELREQVWRLWVSRGANPGENDNRPVMTEILKLRGDRAKLLGFENFAEYQTSARMAGSPKRALDLLRETWDLLLPITLNDIAGLQAVADNAGADFELQPWDRMYYAEKYRQQQFSLDADAVKPYLSLDNVVDAMFWAAGETFGFQFKELDDVDVISPDIRVFEVSLKGNLLGVLWVDLFQRTGKGPASWASQYRSAEDFRGRVLPLVALHSAVTPPAGPEDPVLVPWERANVIFHEFGHVLHTLSNGAAYPSLGSLAAPWDFIEVPSLLNERWLLNRTTLKRFARHHETGEPMPDELIDRIERVAQYDRVFSASLNFLATAIVDMELHLRADGREIDAMAVEQEVLNELQLPQAIDLTLYVPHAFHTFTEHYAAGVYTYLWSDVIAADIAEVFSQAPGGFFDTEVGQKYWTTMLQAANTVPAVEAFRQFRGREQADPAALMRRFDLEHP